MPRFSRFPAILLWSLFCTGSPALAEPFYAAELTADNIERLPAGGLDAVGGVGDWFLTDGELCAVVSGAGHPTYLSLTGGTLVDLWHCALANDQWSVLHGQYNLQKDQIPPIVDIAAGSDATRAWVETRGERGGLESRVRFILSAEHPGELAVETTVTRVADGDGMGMYGALVLHPSGALTPFTVDTVLGEDTLGFDQPYVDTTDFTSILGAVTSADLQVLLGSRHIRPSISYGVRLREAVHRDAAGEESPVHTFLISSRTFTLFGAFTRPFPGFWTRTPGPLSFGLGQLFDLDRGDSLVLGQRIGASARGDVASLLDGFYSGPFIEARLDTAEAGVQVRDADGRGLTFARPDADGRVRMRLPAGIRSATLAVRTPWGTTERPLSIAGDTLQLGTLATGSPGILRLPRGDTMSLVLLSESGPAIFHDELAGGQVAGERKLSGPESHRLSLAGIPSDPAEIALPPGDYRVIASRGPEYTVTEARVSLAAGSAITLDIEPPQRAVATPGLLGADFHVHSGVSFDSGLQPEQRLRDFVAQGGELLVASEHNITFDLQPAIEAMGLAGAIAGLPGVEITGMARSPAAPTTIGHSNVFPVPVDADAFMGGTLPFEGRRLGQVIGDYKAAHPDSIFQLNHPRSQAHDDDISFFNHLSIGQSFEPARPLEEPPNRVLLERHGDSAYRDIDFDAMELLNGASMALYELVRTDWFALLKQNLYPVATANSDSHISSELVAYPRTYVAVSDDDPAHLDTAAVTAALARGAVYGSTGPILRVAMGDTGPGGTHAGGGGKLRIVVDSAPWVDVNEARIWINGKLWRSRPIAAGETLDIPLQVEVDSFVFVEVLGEPSDTYRTVAPGYTPFAFANPLFLDVAGDGWEYGGPPVGGQE